MYLTGGQTANQADISRRKAVCSAMAVQQEQQQQQTHWTNIEHLEWQIIHLKCEAVNVKNHFQIPIQQRLSIRQTLRLSIR